MGNVRWWFGGILGKSHYVSRKGLKTDHCPFMTQTDTKKHSKTKFWHLTKIDLQKMIWNFKHEIYQNEEIDSLQKDHVEIDVVYKIIWWKDGTNI